MKRVSFIEFENKMAALVDKKTLGCQLNIYLTHKQLLTSLEAKGIQLEIFSCLKQLREGGQCWCLLIYLCRRHFEKPC